MPDPVRYGVEIMDPAGLPVGEHGPTWFTDPDDLRAHLTFLRSMPVDGGVQFRVTEYTLTRVAMLDGKASDE